jgi:gamma-glutamyltranspeptidase/glutathione hydrolase
MKSIFFIAFMIFCIGCYNNNSSGAVVSGHPEATKIGIDILEIGGNAIDAAIGVQLALAVCLPSAGNIGGGGFMVYRDKNGDHYSLDFRETSPLNSNTNMYLDSNGLVIDSLSTYGAMSIGVPGTIDGIFQAHRRFGSIPLDTLFNYAIQLASHGFPITKKQAERFNLYQDDFAKFNTQNQYLQKLLWKEGDTLIQTDLAQTLSIIKEKGRSSFYEGEIAKSLIATIKENGIMTLEDLKNYQSVWREPITYNFGKYQLISMPPPSSGGIAISQLLMSLANFNIDTINHNSIEYIHLLSEIEKLVYADRATYLGDPNYYNVPLNELTNYNYNKKRVKDIDLLQARPSNSISEGSFNNKESEETTHFSILDQYGNAASVTTTLNTNYGSKVFVNERGFLLNNEMDDFSSKPGTPNTYGLIGSEANSIEPGKRMLSSMTPTIIEKQGNLFLILGSPGGSTIITSVFQTILNVIYFEMDILSAVNAPRFHHQWKPEYISMETELYSDSINRALNNIGHNIKTRKNIGNVNAIMYQNNSVTVGADKRGDNKSQIIYSLNQAP